MVTFLIDEVEVTVPEETKILDAALRAGIYIPHVCSHPDLPSVEQLKPAEVVYHGDKRLENKKPDLQYEGCQLCVVEIEGKEGLQRACTTPVSEKVTVRTASPEIDEFRRNRIMFLLAKHPHACLTCAQKEGCARFPCSTNVSEKERCCAKFNRCEFQKIAEYVGLKPETPRFIFEDLPVQKEEPLFERDDNLCIGCTRCIRVCKEVRGIGAIDFIFDQEGRVIVGTVSQNLRESACRFCAACVEVCPTGALVEKGEDRVDGREAFLLPCAHNCPAGIDIPAYLRFVGAGNPEAALAVILEKVPFPGILGRVGVHPCESVCRRGKINESIGICALKRYAADQDNRNWKMFLEKAPDTDKKVAIVGSGPSGLTCAFYLRKKGHAVTIFEERPEPGGMLRYGIPEYRLPEEVLEDDLKPIFEMGVDLRLGMKIQSLNDLKELKEGGHDAVFLGLGAQMGRKISIQGADLPGVLWGLDFLRAIKEGSRPILLQKVLVIGGGNVAVDVALSALRLGAKDVSMACLETREEMPALSWEIECAMEEGVKLFTSLGPQRILGDDKIKGIELIKCTSVFDEQGRFNPTFDTCTLQTIETDMVILAIGQATDLRFLGNPPIVETRGGLIVTNPETQETNIPWIYAGGDVARIPGSVIEAIVSGRKAASSIDRFLGGSGNMEMTLIDHPPLNPYLGKEEGFSYRSCQVMPVLPISERGGNFKEVALGFSPVASQEEARRCLQCDLRLLFSKPVLPPKKRLWVEFNQENIAAVPGKEGVFQLLDEQETVIYIKGAMNLRQELTDQLELN